MGVRAPVPLVFGVDLEQDDLRSGADAFGSWSGAEAALRWATSGGHGWHSPRFDWFVRADVQAASVLGSAGPFALLGERLRRRQECGDLVGLHPHLYRKVGSGWRNDFSSPAFAWRCVEIAVQQRHDALAGACLALRWGDRVGHSNLHLRLARLGVRFEMSGEPGRPSMPPRDGGSGFTEFVAWDARRPVLGSCGLVHWPVTTLRRAMLQTPPTGELARAPIGSLDMIDDGWVHGWCADAERPDGPPVDVELLIQGSCAATVSADWLRDDVQRAGVAGARHGIRVAMDDRWRALPSTAFALRPVGATAVLPGAVEERRTERGLEATVEPLMLGSEPQEFERGLDVLLAAEDVLTVVVRSDDFVTAERSAALQANVAQLVGAAASGLLTEPMGVCAAARRLAPLARVSCP